MFQFMNGQIKFYPAHNLTTASSNRAPGTLSVWLLFHYRYTPSRKPVALRAASLPDAERIDLKAHRHAPEGRLEVAVLVPSISPPRHRLLQLFCFFEVKITRAMS